MFWDWEKEHCKNDYATQSNLQFIAIPIELPMAFVTELEQKSSPFVWKHKRTSRAKGILRQKNRAGGIRFPDFRL